MVVADVRGRADGFDPVGLGLPRHRNAVVGVPGPVVDRVEDVTVQVDHRVSLATSTHFDAEEAQDRLQGATGRSEAGPIRHVSTMIGKIMDLLAPGLRGWTGFNSWIKKRPAEGITSLAPITCSSTASSASHSTKRTSRSVSSRRR